MQVDDFTKRLQTMSTTELMSLLTQTQKNALSIEIDKKDETALAKRLDELEKKYCDLLWMARKNPKDLRDSVIKKTFDEVSAKYPGELAKLQGRQGDWTHGFNSGMLACVRLTDGYVCSVDGHLCPEEEEELLKNDKCIRQAIIDEAEEQFPFLDT